MKCGHLFRVCFNFRHYLDNCKVERIKDKSGAPADLVDLYDSEKSTKFDLYSDRWDFAEHMDFFIPACARSAYTVSLGNKQAKTNLKPSTSRELYQEALDVELNDPDPVSVHLLFIRTRIKRYVWLRINPNVAM